MTKQAKVSIRQVQYRDLSAITRLVQQEDSEIASPLEIGLEDHIEHTKNHYGLVKLLDVFPNPNQYSFHGYVLEVNGELVAFVKISPFNSSQSTWRVDQVVIDSSFPKLEYHGSARQPGSTLLRYCFDHVIEADFFEVE